MQTNQLLIQKTNSIINYQDILPYFHLSSFAILNGMRWDAHTMVVEAIGVFCNNYSPFVKKV